MNEVRDSKALTEAEREALFDRSPTGAPPGRSVHASAEECDGWACPRPSGWPPVAPSTASASRPTAVLLDGKWDFVSDGTTRR